MALIGKIRKNSWLLIVVIGLALAAFVIMDMTGQGGPGATQSMTLVDVDGSKVDYLEFQNAEQILYQGSEVDVFTRRNYLYNYYVNKAIVDDEAETLGLGVSRPELLDLQFGNNISALIQQRFADPQTGLVDRNWLTQIKQSIDQGTLRENPQLLQLWAHQEKEIITERLTDKLTNLVSKGFYTPTWLVESTNQDQSVRTDFVYVRVPYEEVPENDVQVSDSDLRSYLNDNQDEFAQEEETRVVSYLAYDVYATSEDTAQLRNQMLEQIEGFETAENDTFYVENNYGSVDFAYVKKATLNPQINDSVFEAPIGSVIGPYQEDGSFKAVKILDRKIIPDSVHARHILRRAQTAPEYQAALKTADSLINLLESGEHTFDSLAFNFNQGSTNVTFNGGDLGTVGLGGFVKPFNDLVFYNAEKGKVYAVATEFGVHVVEVLDWVFETREEGAQVAYLNVPIIPSEETQNSMFDRALELAGNNRSLDDLRNAVADDPNLNVQNSLPLKENDFTISSLGSGQTSRDIIRWAFDPSTEIKEVSPEVFIYQEPTLYYNNKYVVASLNRISAAGQADLETVRTSVEGIVKNQKKAALLIEELQGKKDLAQVAEIYSSSIDTARGVNFLTDFIANMGEEPNVAANAHKVPLNEVSDPIEGVRGVYLIMPFNRTEATEPNVPTLRQSYTSQIANQAKAGLMQSLKESSDIKDFRSRFY